MGKISAIFTIIGMIPKFIKGNWRLIATIVVAVAIIGLIVFFLFRIFMLKLELSNLKLDYKELESKYKDKNNTYNELVAKYIEVENSANKTANLTAQIIAKNKELFELSVENKRLQNEGKNSSCHDAFNSMFDNI